MIDMIKTTGKEMNYELIEYVNDVNREYTEVLMELNINGIMDTAYTYGNERLTNERLTGWTGYYTYDPRGSVSGITDADGMIWQSYRYDGYGNITFGKPEYNNVYGSNAESYNPNVDVQYLRARYYCPITADFLTEDTYLGNISDPLTLNRYNYVKSSPLNYVDPSGHKVSYKLDVDKTIKWAFNEWYQDQVRGIEAWYRNLQEEAAKISDTVFEVLDAVIDTEIESGIGLGAEGTININGVDVSIGAEWAHKYIYDYKGVKEEKEELMFTLGSSQLVLVDIAAIARSEYNWNYEENSSSLTVFGYQIMGIETTKEKESLDDIIWSMGGALYAGPGAGASIQINVSELLRILEILPEKQEYENCE